MPPTPSRPSTVHLPLMTAPTLAVGPCSSPALEDFTRSATRAHRPSPRTTPVAGLRDSGSADLEIHEPPGSPERISTPVRRGTCFSWSFGGFQRFSTAGCPRNCPELHRSRLHPKDELVGGRPPGWWAHGRP